MLSLNSDFVLRKIYNVNLLIPIRKNSIADDAISLNDTAALIIEICKNAESVHDAAMCAFEKFIDDDPNEVVPEMETYIESLIKEGIIIEV